jgi:predicted PurR-regulated permease PerM
MAKDTLPRGGMKFLDGSSPSAAATSKLSGALITLAIAAFVLRVAQDIFVPIALSLLLAFTLAPIVSFLRKRSVPKIAAVIMAVVAAFVVIGLFSLVVATQVANLAQNVPTYQNNIVEKVRALRAAGTSDGILSHLTGAMEKVGAEIQTQAETVQAPTAEASQRQPLPVEIVARPNPIETLGNLILPLINPFATAGLVIVLVIFMLIERESLRDRFIRLVGLHDLHRTTIALQDAGKRVGRYLLMQLIVNSLYAIPISIGLWLLGIPNAMLWGLLTLVLRFVPYIGPVIGMILPLFLAVAISPGWSLLLWVAALFIVVELISNNVLEPWLYGSNTGLSPLAIIIAAIFWSWLWGPLGLVLSTPLTVCLVVLGRHVPQFGFLDVLLGDEPVLAPEEALYQRLLSGDPDEATDNAETLLEEEYLIEYYEKVGIPALLIGELDRQRGVLSEKHMELFSTSAQTLVENLSEIALEEENEPDEAEEPSKDGETVPEEPEFDLPNGEGRSLLIMGGRGAIDDAASAMLGQALSVQGADVAQLSHSEVEGRALRSVAVAEADTAVIVFLNGNSKSHARNLVRRLKRLKPALRVGVYVPLANGQDAPAISAEDISADFVATTLTDSVKSALAETAAVAFKSPSLKLARPRSPLLKTA